MIDRRFALATIAAAIAAPTAARAAGTPLKVATIPLDAGAEVYYAADEGFFRDAGIDVSIEPIPNGAAISSAVAGGAADVGFANLVSIAQAYKRNVPFTLLAPGSLYLATDPTSVLMVPRDSPLKTARDLNGKTLAASGLRTITEFAPRLWMDKNGGDSTTVKFVEMTFPQILEALAQHRIDAAIVAEPFISKAKSVARVFADAYDAVAPRYLIGCWFSTTTWAKSHADIAAKFAQVMERTADWANKNKARSGAILAKYGKLDPEVQRTMLRVDYAPRFVLSEMQPVIDLTAKYRGIPSAFPADELIYRAT